MNPTEYRHQTTLNHDAQVFDGNNYPSISVYTSQLNELRAKPETEIIRKEKNVDCVMTILTIMT